MSLAFPQAPDHRFSAQDRILVVGGASSTLDLLRLATIRSDDVSVAIDNPDDATMRYARRFAIDVRARPTSSSMLLDVDVMLVALDDIDAENWLVRAARRLRHPIHVSGRPLVSDFTLLEFLERQPVSMR